MRFLLTFGDSFSDNGFSNGCGYNRLSNGRVWVEYLAEMLDIPLEDRAWCGARSGMGNASGPPDWSGLAWQADTYQPDENTPDALCTLLIGINDVYGGQGDPGTVADNVGAALEKLLTKGVRRFLVANVPDITLAPAYRTEAYAPLKERVRADVRAVNRLLDSLLFDPNGLAFRAPAASITPLDAFGLFNDMAAGGGFRQPDAPWNGTYAYPHADGHLWWDDWHPTTEAHRQLALAALDALGAG